MKFNKYERIVAYQRLELLDLGRLFSEVEVDLQDYLSREQRINIEANIIQDELSSIRQRLEALGVDFNKFETSTPPSVKSIHIPVKTYRKIEFTDFNNDFNRLLQLADQRLSDAGIDLKQDPLLQIISQNELKQSQDDYLKKFGNIEWTKSDYIIVLIAGLVATLLDIFLVKIPTDTNFLGNMQEGSPITKWIKEKSPEIHKSFFEDFEKRAKVAFDASTDVSLDQEVAGLNPHFHRLMSFGHDPILGFIFGVIDVMKGTGTFVDKYGNLIVAKNNGYSPESNFFIAIIKVFLHLLSDIFTKAGIQPPFFTLVQLIKAKSPFILGPSGQKVSWTDVARYMYKHGYDFRHFLTTGIVPASVDIIIRLYWYASKMFSDDPETHFPKAKLASLLMLGHSIALSGNFIKTGLIYHMNPLALNWSQILRMVPIVISYIKEKIERDKKIRKSIDKEWILLYKGI